MKKYLGIVAVAVCSTVVQAAPAPTRCSELTARELTGPLPAPDYLDVVLICNSNKATSDPAIPPSRWFEADARNYTALLGKQKYPWLVLPAQNQLYGFDRTERALIAAEVADAFANQGAMPDPLLVARALGETRRRLLPGQVDAVVRASGATNRVDIFVGHDGSQRLTLTLQLKQCGASAPCKLVKQHDWRGLQFSDTQPPFRVVNGLRAQIQREFLGAATTKPAANPRVPTSLAGLTQRQAMSESEAPAAVTALLSGLASADSGLTRERLHILNLRAWLDASTTVEGRFFAAYSAMELQRRPYAMAILQAADDPAAHALRELLNGNFIEAQSAISMVKLPLPRLLLEFKLRDLASDYGREVPADEGLAQLVFGATAEEWGALLARRSRDSVPTAIGNTAIAKNLLDAMTPTPDLNIRTLLTKPLPLPNGIGTDRRLLFNLASFEHLNRVLPSLSGGLTTGRWQMYWLLEGFAQADAIGEVRRQLGVLSHVKESLELADKYDPVMAGLPAFEMQRAYSIAQMVQQAGSADIKALRQRYQNAEEMVAYWSQGQTPESRAVVFRGSGWLPFADGMSWDFPRRGYWPEIQDEATRGNRRGACAALEYSVSDTSLVEDCVNQAGEAARPALLAQIERRFHGSPAAESIAALTANASARAPVVATVPAPLVRVALAPAKSKKPVGPEDSTRLNVAEDALDKDPQSWDARYDLGLLKLQREGAYEAAQRLFLDYPGFQPSSGQNPIHLSNYAYQAGNHFYWNGRFDQARPLYEIAAELDTGSNASIVSRARLAQLDGDYRAAIDGLLSAGSRYQHGYVIRDALSLLYATGHGTNARLGFEQVARDSEAPESWVGELVGQRMGATTYEQMKAWVTSDDIRKIESRGVTFAAYFALVWATTDRTPTADLPALIDELELDAFREADGGQVIRPHPMAKGSRALVPPSAFRKGKAPRLRDGTRVKSELVLFADALTAMHARQYDAAMTKFDALADRYSVDNSMGIMYVLPYYARAAAKTGDKEGFEAFVESLDTDDTSFDVLLARASFAAVRRDSDRAEQLLSRALRFMPLTEVRPVLPEYAYAEICEFISLETEDPRFKRLLIDWAKRHQRIQPAQAWAYAVEAQYSKNLAEADKALAIALYLDPESPRLAKIDAKRRSAAQSWLKANNPFLRQSAPEKAERSPPVAPDLHGQPRT